MKPRKSTPNDYAKEMTKGGFENAGSKFAEDKLGNSVKHFITYIGGILPKSMA